MNFKYNDKRIPEKLKKFEEEELIEYCKTQGFSEEQTEIFVKNSLDNLYRNNE